MDLHLGQVCDGNRKAAWQLGQWELRFMIPVNQVKKRHIRAKREKTSAQYLLLWLIAVSMKVKKSRVSSA